MAPPATATDTARAFQALIRQERTAIGAASQANVSVTIEPSGEPWVSSTSDDLAGLALSGGGLRSATFNLGLLQGLAHLDLLRHVDYLSTVSGGGYIGGFWSKWLAAHPRASDRTPAPSRAPESGHEGDAARFPQSPPAAGALGSQVTDTPEIRHLREFSRFLSPRLGFFQADLWRAILAFAGGLIPALVATLSLIAAGFASWALATGWLGRAPQTAAAADVILAAIVLAGFEWVRPSRSGARRRTGSQPYAFFALVALAFVWIWHAAVVTWLDRMRDPIAIGAWTLHASRAATPFWPAGLLATSGPQPSIYLPLFTVAIVMAAASLTYLPVWLILRTRRGPGAVRDVNALERVVMRLLGIAVAWLVVGILWAIGVALARTGWSALWTTLTAMLSGGTLGLLRNWLSLVFRPTGHRNTRERLRPLLPQALAYLAIACTIVSVVSVLAAHVPAHASAWIETICVFGAVLACMLVLDPNAYSLHAYCRDRIARAYLGATESAPSADDRAEARGAAASAACLRRAGAIEVAPLDANARNRGAQVRPTDDGPLDETTMPARPLHLICCAANDLSGDQVETLARGSRSATLSRLGIAIGGRSHAPRPPITLGSALTASAAAFNPVMGTISKQLGPAVTFVMAALNLRLGYWTRHPAARVSGAPPLVGWRFFKELFGVTFSGLGADGAPHSADVHLSDGGHFENLALYELVRRHCRYVIVSDVGADPTLAFDDLANAVRRIREDFGVEIEIDLAPLRAEAAGNRQHAVVGTIHYDRQFDKGVLIYVKPTLTGNEPPDVAQYHARNPAFPHESTTDQFYDEAQWESYRRLGFHSVEECFRFVARHADTLPRDRVFTDARTEWYPTPPDLGARIVSMTDRADRLERELRAERQWDLLAELFPETAASGAVAPQSTSADGEGAGEAGSADARDLRTVTFLLKAMQVMEDVWMACSLDTEWKHPLNTGWLNTFARWATAPSFVTWWPILAPNFAQGFQRFVRERFYASHARLDFAQSLRVMATSGPALPPGLARDWWIDRIGAQPRTMGRTIYECRLRLADGSRELQVALVLVSREDEDGRPDARAGTRAGRARISSCRRASGARASARPFYRPCSIVSRRTASTTAMYTSSAA